LSITSSCRDIKELNSKAQVACKLFMTECEKRGINIFITETYRQQERQNYLYEQGRTRPGDKVTWTKSSRHTSRMAWDIACGRPNNLYDTNILARAGEVAKALGITWGGTWSKPDRPHFEISKNWVVPKKQEKKQEVEEMVEKRYNTLAEVPEWGKVTIKKLIDKGGFADPNKLDLTFDILRVYVNNDRIGLYK